jgi:Domain of unknown function (DUF4410)
VKYEKLRTSWPLKFGVLVFALAWASLAFAKNPLAHGDIKTIRSYDRQTPLPKPERIIVYAFTVSPAVVKTEKMPGLRQRIKQARSHQDAATLAAQQVQAEITKDLIKVLQKQLKTSGIPVEKGAPDVDVPGNALTIRGVVTKLDQGHRLRRGTVGFGAGASDVETDCQISMQTRANTWLLSELNTKAKSSKKPGAVVPVAAGASAAVAGGATVATSNRSIAQGDAARTGSALAKQIAKLMKIQGWTTTGS